VTTTAPSQQQQRKADVWSDGSGLFDLSNLKAGDKSRLESQNPVYANANQNLVSNKDDLNKLWEQSSGFGQSSFGQFNAPQQ
jgi:hypothetical protein